MFDILKGSSKKLTETVGDCLVRPIIFAEQFRLREKSSRRVCLRKSEIVPLKRVRLQHTSGRVGMLIGMTTSPKLPPLTVLW